MAESTMDRLTGQLYHLPKIIGSLGLNIAESQKQLNADYVRNIQKLMYLVDKTLGQEKEPAQKAEKAKAVQGLLESLAPSRYQYTETTLDFSADLAEAEEQAFAGGIGVNFSAVMVNASFVKGYAYDYRAAARITAKIHAIQPGAQMAKELIERAAQIDDKHKPALPQPTDTDKEYLQAVESVYNSLTGSDAKVVAKEDKKTPGAGPG